MKLKNQIDLGKNVKEGGWAIYLPALSSFVAVQLGKMDADPNFVSPARIPKGFETGHKGLNYMDKDNAYYYYPYSLYSAGHAERNLSKCVAKEPMIHNRDREKTILLGDSGGFQVATGVIKADWKNFKGPDGDKLREEILRFLETSFDYSMTLDIPAFAAEPPLSQRTGLTQFKDTLDLTEHNLHYFMKNRIPGKTKFLNVLSGSSPENARQWYETVKHFSKPSSVKEMGYSEDRTLEAWAFAGINMKNMYCVLDRILSLREDNLLHNKDWIHFLGIGRIDWACYLTSIKKQLQKHDNPNINISFDAASAFVCAAYAKVFSYNSFTPNKFLYTIDKAIDDKKFKNSKLAMPYQSPIMNRLNVGDVCVLGPNDSNKNGKIGKTSWDTFSYLLYMQHSLYNHIQAVQEANRLADIEYVRYNVSYKDWSKNKKAGSISDFVPNNILFFNNFVEVLLDPNTKNPRQILEDSKAFLNHISFGGTTTNTFNDLFSLETPELTEDQYADLNDEKLTDLENQIK